MLITINNNKNILKFCCTFLFIFNIIQLCLSCDLKKCDKSFQLCIEKKLCECNSTKTEVPIDSKDFKDTKTTLKSTNNKNTNNIKLKSKLSELKLKCRPTKDCFKCMGYLYPECCNCADGLCPKSLRKDDLTRMSHVGDFPGESKLYNALTKTPGIHDEWTVFTFPNDLSPFTANLDTNEVNELQSRESNICTVLFMDQCLSANQCEKTCESLGANAYRWFHNGCCECVGENCLNYGISHSKCKICGNEDIEEGGGDDDDDYFEEKDEL